MSVDFPRAWQITRNAAPDKHDAKCSFRTHGMLCDCDVLMNHPETIDSVLQGKDGVIIGDNK